MAKACFVSPMTSRHMQVLKPQKVRILSVKVTAWIGKPCVARFDIQNLRRICFRSRGFLHNPPKRCTRLHLGISFVHIDMMG